MAGALCCVLPLSGQKMSFPDAGSSRSSHERARDRTESSHVERVCSELMIGFLVLLLLLLLHCSGCTQTPSDESATGRPHRKGEKKKRSLQGDDMRPGLATKKKTETPTTSGCVHR